MSAEQKNNQQKGRERCLGRSKLLLGMRLLCRWNVFVMIPSPLQPTYHFFSSFTLEISCVFVIVERRRSAAPKDTILHCVEAEAGQLTTYNANRSLYNDNSTQNVKFIRTAAYSTLESIKGKNKSFWICFSLFFPPLTRTCKAGQVVNESLMGSNND